MKKETTGEEVVYVRTNEQTEYFLARSVEGFPTINECNLTALPASSLCPRWVKADTLPEIFDGRYSHRVLCLTSSGLMRVGYILNGEWVEDNRGTRFFNNG